ncbi:hypothetical protein SAPIO_CDS10231 [Scedosporium apiospermum]|uniref:2EXR domain-containing protein n=1 Tax=Pseudallescheria apiosperma TaxID=563466 RepID=A0A084FUZ7_PSEDA|nr:uncharacterized protein SAPIO_CDS10231 [Scedosporium apiospermum]KEZ38909.1 hypothetical protein SAPIO_CDS10231 [Scedosporium apiospermum]
MDDDENIPWGEFIGDTIHVAVDSLNELQALTGNAVTSTTSTADNDAQTQQSQTLTSFPQFPNLPPEIRSRIFQMAMLQPGIIYFSMQPSHFEDHIHLHAVTNCNSTWRQWKMIAHTSVEAAHAVNLVVTKGATKHYVDLSKKRPFNKVDDLLVIQFATNPQIINQWTVATAAPVDFVYNSYFRSLRRVGFKWNEKTFRCHGHVEDEVSPDWPVYHDETDDDDDIVRCIFPCKDMFERFPMFFRDADAVYILYSVKGKDLSPTFKKQARDRNVSPMVDAANYIRDTPKSCVRLILDDNFAVSQLETETRCDARQKWVEMPIGRMRDFLNLDKAGP